MARVKSIDWGSLEEETTSRGYECKIASMLSTMSDSDRAYCDRIIRDRDRPMHLVITAFRHRLKELCPGDHSFKKHRAQRCSCGGAT